MPTTSGPSKLLRPAFLLAMLPFVATCSILDGPTEPPTTARIVVGGTGPGPLTLVTSNQFIQTFGELGESQLNIAFADTVEVDVGFDDTFALGNGWRLYAALSRPEGSEDFPLVSLTLIVRGEAICDQQNVTLSDDNPAVCLYRFN